MSSGCRVTFWSSLRATNTTHGRKSRRCVTSSQKVAKRRQRGSWSQLRENPRVEWRRRGSRTHSHQTHEEYGVAPGGSETRLTALSARDTKQTRQTRHFTQTPAIRTSVTHPHSRVVGRSTPQTRQRHGTPDKSPRCSFPSKAGRKVVSRPSSSCLRYVGHKGHLERAFATGTCMPKSLRPTAPLNATPRFTPSSHVQHSTVFLLGL